MYWREISVLWGESDPFGLVYYPRIVAWFNDTEHELFRTIGYPIDQMIRKDRTTFVMGEIHFRFVGPASYSDRVMTKVSLEELGERTLNWNCVATNVETGELICEGRAVRIYAKISEDGNLESQQIPDFMRTVLNELGQIKQLGNGLIDEVNR